MGEPSSAWSAFGARCHKGGGIRPRPRRAAQTTIGEFGRMQLKGEDERGSLLRGFGEPSPAMKSPVGGALKRSSLADRTLDALQRHLGISAAASQSVLAGGCFCLASGSMVRRRPPPPPPPPPPLCRRRAPLLLRRLCAATSTPAHARPPRRPPSLARLT